MVDKAKVAYELMERIYAILDAKLFNNPGIIDKKKLIFSERIKLKNERRIIEGIYSLVKEVKSIAEGNILSELTEQEAA